MSSVFHDGSVWARWVLNSAFRRFGDRAETISNISEELMSPHIPLFIPTPNNASNTGDRRSAWMPNPGCLDLEMFAFVGRLFAGANLRQGWCYQFSSPRSLYMQDLCRDKERTNDTAE
jgi:hypothetical protein